MPSIQPSFAAASGVRMGAQEMTRFGMKEADFAELAGLVADIVGHGGKQSSTSWTNEAMAFRERFTEMQYCL